MLRRDMEPSPLILDRLILRPPVLADAPVIHRNWATDPLVTRYLVWAPHKSVEETRAFLRFVAESWESGAEFTWLLCRKTDGEPIGSISLRKHGDKAGIGYALARAQWGQGYMVEAGRRIVALALADPAIRQVGAFCDLENTASARVLEKLGMTRQELLKRWLVHPTISDEPRDCYFYALMRPHPIVEATAADLPALRAVVDAAYSRHIPRIGRKPLPMEADYAALVAANQVWVMRDGQAVIGVLVLIGEPDHLLLENVCVAPERQGQGIGLRLLRFTEEEARRRGYAEVRLYTNVRFIENIALYLRHGYHETHRAGQDGFERVFLRKVLPRR
jgi:ribosomal-protein-alanine N-acetyltransferase